MKTKEQNWANRHETLFAFIYAIFCQSYLYEEVESSYFNNANQQNKAEMEIYRLLDRMSKSINTLQTLDNENKEKGR